MVVDKGCAVITGTLYVGGFEGREGMLKLGCRERGQARTSQLS
jgi:hypothetical protein